MEGVLFLTEILPNVSGRVKRRTRVGNEEFTLQDSDEEGGVCDRSVSSEEQQRVVRFI